MEAIEERESCSAVRKAVNFGMHRWRSQELDSLIDALLRTSASSDIHI